MLLHGKAELIDNSGRLKVIFTDNTTRQLLYDVKHKGIKPFRSNGFIVRMNKAKIFAPTMTDQPSMLLGHNIQIDCDIKKYNFSSKGECYSGWSIVATRVTLVD